MSLTQTQLREALPKEGLFDGKQWRLSPEAFPLSPARVARLREIGPRLLRFHRACESLYLRSRRGSAPTWVADLIDAGKPASLRALNAAPGLRGQLPRVIRPDLILTEEGFALTEVDSVPGGIGLTAWLNQVYATAGGEAAVIGGAEGMLAGFDRIFPRTAQAVEVVMSRESADYRPEMAWLTGQLQRLADEAGRERHYSVRDGEGFQPRGAALYRFFELFDLPNLPGASELGQRAAAGELSVTAPFRTLFEEKLWLALLWSRPLRELWRRELRDSHFRKLQDLVPYGWVLDPQPLPPHAVLPGLDIQDFRELEGFSQKERQLVLKASGFSELAWGSRSVRIGHDLSREDWGSAVQAALDAFPRRPHLMQVFHQGRTVTHPYWDDLGNEREMEGRVRLCPYYFVDEGDEVSLGGVLATICPADKKILHGMEDAVMVPCREDEAGY